jgi:hypothetical protein
MVKNIGAVFLRLKSRRLAACLAAAVAFGVSCTSKAAAQSVQSKPKPTLQETGLYADFEMRRVDTTHLAFAPQYPLWTDGATKRRWMWLPPGETIDGSDPDNWKFPIGTRFWKEFSFNGRRVETRYMELQENGQWLYAAYAWSPDGGEAQLVSQRGRRGAYDLANGRSHSIPSTSDCKACHQGERTEVLGFGALQLSHARDPHALHADPVERVDLAQLIEKGLLVGMPGSILQAPPRIVASNATERVVLGYMHGNCGHCHNDHGSLKNLGLSLRHVLGASIQSALTSTVGHPIKKRAPGQSNEAVLRVEPHHPDRSGLLERVASRYPALQMPPLGTELVDAKAVAALRCWISELESGGTIPQGGKSQ